MPIISGHATANGATIITIPANTSWIGSLSIAARVTPSSAIPYIEVFSAGGTQPPSGTRLLACALSAQISASNNSTDLVYVETGANSAVLRIQFDTASAVIACANGYGS